jgi:hypothetical protein
MFKLDKSKMKVDQKAIQISSTQVPSHLSSSSTPPQNIHDMIHMDLEFKV